jgi:multidrug efflux pump subunit AcrB
MGERNSTFFGGIIQAFLRGNLSVLLILISVAAGVVALNVTPREEEPQIVVPLADVLVSYPGGSAEEVEQMVASRLERLLYQIDGVEYVYSMSRPGLAVVTVRFFVGEDREDSLIKLYNKIFQNIDRTTPGIAGWVVKPIEIDDVPVITAALWAPNYDEHELYRVAEEVADKLQHVPDSARVTLHGGRKRVAQVNLDTERLGAHGLSIAEVASALKVSNAQSESGSFDQKNTSVRVESGPFLRDVEEVRNLVVGLRDGRPVYLRDVAEVLDAAEEVRSYSRIGFGPAAGDVPAWAREGETFPAVTLAVAKKKGSNAVRVAEQAERTLRELRGPLIPDEVEVRVTRNYGETANDKVNSLVHGLLEAVITVIGLIALAMNWRVGLIVAVAVPITYSVTLLANYLLGYTINRVTLFALILALGLLVDDPIVGVENIYRHLGLRRLPRLEAIVAAMNEVLPPVVLATLAIVVAFLPMFFITGMMGPYMRPMAINVPLAMLSSMLVSFTITPWLSNRLLKTGAPRNESDGDPRRTKVYRVYRGVLRRFVSSRRGAVKLLLFTLLLFVGAALLPVVGLVPLKMLPFDNKNEFQVVVDLPESATLEATAAVVQEIEHFLKTQPEVTDFTSTVGTASPMDFNGLVRHYYLREGPHLADVRVNLLHRADRSMDSHAIVLRIRDDIAAIARRTGASIKLVEVPPGPPVLSTVVAEIRGQPHHRYEELIAAAAAVRSRLAQETGVVDVDDSVEADQPKLFFRVDREKAGRNGVSTEDVVQTLRIALGGMPGGFLHLPMEKNELPLLLQLPRAQRSDAERLKTVPVKGRAGHMVPLGEIGEFEERRYDKTILHKNQERVVYVTAEMAGRGPANAVRTLQSWFKRHPLPDGIRADWRGEGEWKITLDVFRDLGIAFGAALLGIYVLLVYETASYLLPVVVMMSIPLTVIGILPGFAVLNLMVNRPVGGFPNPVFFTATAMIGMIALAGIVVRNGIILIDFIRTTAAQGRSLEDALYESGAVRLRPILLTAGTTLLGAWPITLDPIFSGLAWSLIFGLFVSTAFTLVVIPTMYYLIYAKRP